MYYSRKKVILKRIDVWFFSSDSWRRRKFTLVNYNNLYSRLEFAKPERVVRSREGETLVSSLLLSEQELLNKCESNVRNEIRRAKKDGVNCKVFSGLDLDSETLAQFEKDYAEMHSKKGMQHNSSIPFLTILNESNKLIITKAEINGATIAWHCYIVGDHIARLLYSVSLFRNVSDSVSRNAIGRGNRLLHFEDILWFKQNGYRSYDWGGYGHTADVASISAFKKSFGGDQCNTYYYTTTTCSLLFLFLKLARFFKK